MEYIERVTKFLEEYLKIPPEVLDENGNIQEDAIQPCVEFLLKEKVFTKESMREKALKDYAVILPHSYFA